MLRATLREYLGGVEQQRHTIPLDRGLGSVTIGRGESCTYQIGKPLGEWARGISRVQATIEFTEQGAVLLDGTRQQATTNGIWVQGEAVKTIALVPGLELTLFRHESAQAKINLVVNDDAVEVEPGKDTYTGEDLLQAQVSRLQEQTHRIEEQVGLMAAQLVRREEIDAHQSEVIDQLQRRVRRIIGGLLGVLALVVLGSGLAKDLSGDERKEWGALARSILKEVVIAGALGTGAVYIQKEKGDTKAG